jgi:hypothetical protein
VSDIVERSLYKPNINVIAAACSVDEHCGAPASTANKLSRLLWVFNGGRKPYPCDWLRRYGLQLLKAY